MNEDWSAFKAALGKAKVNDTIELAFANAVKIKLQVVEILKPASNDLQVHVSEEITTKERLG